jgi:hypothetical protein
MDGEGQPLCGFAHFAKLIGWLPWMKSPARQLPHRLFEVQAPKSSRPEFADQGLEEAAPPLANAKEIARCQSLQHPYEFPCIIINDKVNFVVHLSQKGGSMKKLFRGQ